MVIRTHIRRPSGPGIMLECCWRLVELFPDPVHQLPCHPDCLTILKERKDPIVVLPLLVAGAPLPPLPRHLYLAALLLKVVPELYVHMDLPRCPLMALIVTWMKADKLSKETRCWEHTPVALDCAIPGEPSWLGGSQLGKRLPAG